MNRHYLLALFALALIGADPTVGHANPLRCRMLARSSLCPTGTPCKRVAVHDLRCNQRLDDPSLIVGPWGTRYVTLNGRTGQGRTTWLWLSGPGKRQRVLLLGDARYLQLAIGRQSVAVLRERAGGVWFSQRDSRLRLLPGSGERRLTLDSTMTPVLRTLAYDPQRNQFVLAARGRSGVALYRLLASGRWSRQPRLIPDASDLWLRIDGKGDPHLMFRTWGRPIPSTQHSQRTQTFGLWHAGRRVVAREAGFDRGGDWLGDVSLLPIGARWRTAFSYRHGRDEQLIVPLDRTRFRRLQLSTRPTTSSCVWAKPVRATGPRLCSDLRRSVSTVRLASDARGQLVAAVVYREIRRRLRMVPLPQPRCNGTGCIEMPSHMVTELSRMVTSEVLVLRIDAKAQRVTVGWRLRLSGDTPGLTASLAAHRDQLTLLLRVSPQHLQLYQLHGGNLGSQALPTGLRATFHPFTRFE